QGQSRHPQTPEKGSQKPAPQHRANSRPAQTTGSRQCQIAGFDPYRIQAQPMNRTGNILLVDDDPSLLRLLALRLEGEGHSVHTAASADLALKALATFAADCVITDLRMNGMDGLGLLEQLGREHPSLPVILLTAHGSIPDAVNATRGGALDFLTKPVDKQTLLARVDQALAQTGAPQAAWQALWQERVITRSPQMLQLLEDARLVADTNTSVLIQGESGTGKEVLARLLHD